MSGTTSASHVWRPSNARYVAIDGFLPSPRGAVQTTAFTLSWPAKDPADVLDYAFDISAALIGSPGDTITSVTAQAKPSGVGDLVVNSIATDGALAVFWLAGGQSGVVYTLQINVTTASGRIVSRAVSLPVLALTSIPAVVTSLSTEQGTIVSDQNGNPILLGS